MCYPYIRDMNRIPLIQKLSGVYTSLCLDTDKVKMALRARKVSGAFENQAPELKVARE